MRLPQTFFCLAVALLSSHVQAQQPANNMPPPAPHAKEIHLKHVLVIGQSKGFEISEEDVREYVSGHGGDGELSDAQLGAVAGGKHKAAEPQPIYIAQGIGESLASPFAGGGTIPKSAV